MLVTIWLTILQSEELGREQDCIIPLGDITLGIGWLYKSSKLHPGCLYYKPVQMIARQLAPLNGHSNHCLASQQHIKGERNTVSDLLCFPGNIRGSPRPP